MALGHSIHAMMVAMSENWWRAGIMPCLRSDVERDKPVGYIFWLVEGIYGPGVVRYRITFRLCRAAVGSREKLYRSADSARGAWR